MKKISLITVVLLLSAAWVVAQTSPSSPSSQSPSTQSPSTTQSPSSTSPTAQQPETSTTGSEKGGKAIEGCLNGSAGAYTLTDASGTTYQLSGDTSKLAEHVGHQIRVWGESSPSSTSSATSPSGASASASAQPTLNVTRVKMVSASCPTK